MTAVEDQQYFTILAVYHALNAAKVLRELGESVPKVRQDPELAAWRDIAEHWADPLINDKRIGALSRWRKKSDLTEPELIYGSEGYELTDISGVDLRQLTADLRALRQAAGLGDLPGRDDPGLAPPGEDRRRRPGRGAGAGAAAGPAVVAVADGLRQPRASAVRPGTPRQGRRAAGCPGRAADRRAARRSPPRRRRAPRASPAIGPGRSGRTSMRCTACYRGAGNTCTGRTGNTTGGNTRNGPGGNTGNGCTPRGGNGSASSI